MALDLSIKELNVERIIKEFKTSSNPLIILEFEALS